MITRAAGSALAAIVLFFAGAAGANGAVAAPVRALVATYNAQPPASIGAGLAVSVSVTVTNVGDETWPAAGPTPVNLSYHWYDAAGNAVTWNGTRATIGQDTPPAASRTIASQVAAPSTPGTYILRFALVKEGVAWFAPGPPHTVTVPAAFQATFGQVTLPSFVATGTYTLSVPVTNSGVSAWPALGSNPVTLSYHWHDASGATVVWDGLRTSLAADVAAGSQAGAPVAAAATPVPTIAPIAVNTPQPAPGATPIGGVPAGGTPQPVAGATPAPIPAGNATVRVKVVAPAAPGPYFLTIDLVREGVGWFQSLGPTVPLKLLTNVAPVTNTASYAADVGGATSAFIGETRRMNVVVTNTGNVPITTSGPNPVNLAYHLFDAAGRTVLWEGPRTLLGADLAPGASRTVGLTYTAPPEPGAYVLALDLVKEGVSWYSGLDVPSGRIALNVTSGLSAGFGATTTPSQATIGATLQLSVELTNYGPRTWQAGGATPMRLSYHIFDANGRTVVWEGNRGNLPRDVAANQTVTVPIDVELPQATGSYTIAWDVVQEGVAWFSSYGVLRKEEPVSVQPGVTFHGSGFGHGLGLSQFGAQGYATGAAGPPLTGEQIIAKYYVGTTLAPVDFSRGSLRVLLSAPSSFGAANCGMPAFNGSLANVFSNGGFRVLNEGAANAGLGAAAAGTTWQIAARGGVVQVWNQVTVTKVYEGPGPVVLVPADPNQPIRWNEKGTYRGNFKFTNSGGALRVVNYVNYDDYVRGVVPLEMPAGWHLEAYKAQTYAARSYAYARYAGGARDYDVTDDQSSQCYGGAGSETPITSRAASATSGKVIMYQGQVVTAYFASSNGGYTMSDGCWLNNIRTVNGQPTCSGGQPYLTPVPDPADRAVRLPVPNKHARWVVSFTSAQIRDAVLRYKGIDIGTLTSVDVTNRAPAVVGHVISVKLRGTGGAVDLPADTFLRSYLGLKSTMVRLNPF